MQTKNMSVRLSERLFLDDRRLSASLKEKGRRRQMTVSTNPFSFPPRAENNNITSLSQEESTREKCESC
jgi:hypothetical protein